MRIALFGAIGFLAVPSLIAAPINHGDFMGDDVTYLQVTEDSNSGDTPPLFGVPVVSGNSLDFNPIGFSAFASGLGGVDITEGNLSFTIDAKPGQAIQNIKFVEFGDTTLAGLGNDNTTTMVTTDVFIDIIEVDNVGIDPVKLQAMLVFTPSGGSFVQGTDGGGGPIFNSQWMGMLLVDIDQELVNANVNFDLGATRVKVDLDNTLVAVSQLGTSSRIAKKDHVIITTNIPEPATCVLALFSLLAGMPMVRRSR